MAVGSTARKPFGMQLAYLVKRIDYNDTADASVDRHTIGKIPAGSKIVFCNIGIVTGFSAAGTRVLTVGSNGTTANNIFATTLTEETASGATDPRGMQLTFASDTTIYAKLTTAGTAAAAGRADIVVAYVVANTQQEGSLD